MSYVGQGIELTYHGYVHTFLCSCSGFECCVQSVMFFDLEALIFQKTSEKSVGFVLFKTELRFEPYVVAQRS
jgi:hypothetical protein